MLNAQKIYLPEQQFVLREVLQHPSIKREKNCDMFLTKGNNKSSNMTARVKPSKLVLQNTAYYDSFTVKKHSS